VSAGAASTRAATASPAVALWRFARPHTVIGTTISIIGLYVLVAEEATAPPLWDLACTLVAGWCVNVFIVGVNEITDVEIDRVNKPFLPLASGELSMGAARWIVGVCAVVPVAMALTQGALETGAVLAGLAVGAAYSLPPLRLKRFPLVASLCITGVRAVVVTAGVWALTLFVLPFAFAIAVLKDVPDLEGDRSHHIRTFTVRMGGRAVLRMGLAALAVAYLGMAILGPLLLEGAQPVVLAGTHLLVLAVLVRAGLRADPADPADFTRFYMTVWKAFFLEYALVPLAYVV
jgi:homogentisate phytyltransferase/homogentisate geranylgeranyltransferase